MTSLIRTCLRVGICCSLSASAPAWAHDPFDATTRMIVQDDRIEMEVTLGSDAARQFLRSAGLPPREVTALTRMMGAATTIDVPVSVARGLFEVRLGPELLDAKSFAGQAEEGETVFVVVYPRPTAGTLLMRASYLDDIEFMRTGSFVAGDSQGRLLVRALLSRTNASLQVPLPAANANTSPAGSGSHPLPRSSFGEFLKLGLEHILTGFDHLLFLCALLLGVRKPGPMLTIITCFTLAHSVTLALAALDVVVPPSRVIEPLIAASIIVTALGNMLRKDATADRYWLAGGFGLIHGFGFAGVLRETGLARSVDSIAMPLFSFNLGVEAGQLVVAAVFVPLLLLLRRRPAFARHGSPIISAFVIVISGYWLLERTLLPR